MTTTCDLFAEAVIAGCAAASAHGAHLAHQRLTADDFTSSVYAAVFTAAHELTDHPTPTAQQATEWARAQRLNDVGVKPSVNKLEEAVKGQRAAKLEALRCLIDEGHVTIEAGARNAVLHVLVKPYKEIIDPRSDRYLTLHDDCVDEDEVA